jgi:hypothetical protein
MSDEKRINKIDGQKPSDDIKDTSLEYRPPLTAASSKRFIAPLSIYDSKDSQLWECAYDTTMDKKYKKNTRRYSKKIVGKPMDCKEPPIFLIPRQRGGPSYKNINLEGVDIENVQFCLISKGFGMQDVSSFTLGPIVGEGLCLVNAAYSKSVCVMHLIGGGYVDLKRKNFWHSGKSKRKIELKTRVADETLLNCIQVAKELVMIVDGKEYNIETWLRENEKEWLPEWEK